MNRRNPVVAMTWVMLWPAAASAHHSTAAFDPAGDETIGGVVTRLEWRSPHVYITVRDRKGTDWVVEVGPPGVLVRSGWKRDSIRVKQEVVVRGRPHRNPDRKELLLAYLIGPDDNVLSMGHRAPPAAQGLRTSTLAGLWLGDTQSTVSSAQKLATHPLTERGRAAKAAFRPEMDPAAYCIAWTSPFLVLASVVYPTRIQLNGKTVIFHSEFYDTRRVVRMDRREHPANGKPTPQGDSVGWWEGKTLVVDTRQFAPTRSQFRDPYEGLPSGKDKHVVERYTLGKDGTTLTVDFRMEDPEYLAEPLTGSVMWRYAPDLPVASGKCNRKSASQFLR